MVKKTVPPFLQLWSHAITWGVEFSSTDSVIQAKGRCCGLSKCSLCGLKAQQWGRQSSSGAVFQDREADWPPGVSGKGHKKDHAEGDVGADILYRCSKKAQWGI